MTCVCSLYTYWPVFYPGQGNKEPHRLASVNTDNTNHIHNLHLSLHDRTCTELFITSPFKKSTYYWALHWYIGCQTNPVSPNKWLFFPPHLATCKSWCRFSNASIPYQVLLKVCHVSQVLPWRSVMFYIKVPCIFNDKLCTAAGP